jgi:translation initiation factor IF-2
MRSLDLTAPRSPPGGRGGPALRAPPGGGAVLPPAPRPPRDRHPAPEALRHRLRRGPRGHRLRVAAPRGPEVVGLLDPPGHLALQGPPGGPGLRGRPSRRSPPPSSTRWRAGPLCLNKPTAPLTEAGARRLRLVFPAPGRAALVKKTYFAVGRGGAILPVALLAKPPDSELPVPERAPVPAASATGILDLPLGETVRGAPGDGGPGGDGRGAPAAGSLAARSLPGLRGDPLRRLGRAVPGVRQLGLRRSSPGPAPPRGRAPGPPPPEPRHQDRGSPRDRARGAGRAGPLRPGRGPGGGAGPRLRGRASRRSSTRRGGCPSGGSSTSWPSPR